MSTETGLEIFRQRLSLALSRVTAHSWEEPALVSRRLIAIVFALLAVLGSVLYSLGISSPLTTDPMGALVLVFLVWVLSSRRMSQILVGMFLIATFVLSLILLVLPVEELVNSVTQTVEKYSASRVPLTLVSLKIYEAKNFLSSLAINDSDPQTSSNLNFAIEALNTAISELPSKEEDLPEKLLRDSALTISKLLIQSAPFIFTMLMGLMGSAIAVSRQFVSNFEEKPAIWYLYRLLQGMIIALLIVYGLVAGMLSLGVNTGNQPIDIAKFGTNKYFIGFVSALAGLFSEHAFGMLESVSANVFGNTTNKGVGREEIEGQGIATRNSGEPATGHHDAGRDRPGA